MKVCTTYGSPVPLRKGAEMHEIRLDVYDGIPKDAEGELLLTLCGKDITEVPDSFSGLVDVGERDIRTPHRKIKSYHDFERTPDADSIVGMLSEGDQEISKGAFIASSFTDLHNIMEASKRLERKHVLLGMGAIGEVTRIRQNLLGNEFTFGYHGESTAPGQLSAEEMEALGDDCRIVGLVGYPLGHSMSPAMQNAAIQSKGINGKYLLFESPNLDHVEDVIREYDIRGMNVTIPYKRDIMSHLDRISDTAEKVGAVNTIVNLGGSLNGSNTDVTGIEYALRGMDLKSSKALIMGSGGAARAAAYALTESGCDTYICGRNEETVKQLCDDFGIQKNNGSLDGMDILINCTPIGLVEGEYPADLTGLRDGMAVFDMVYGRETPLIKEAKARGCSLIDGKDMLVGQGAKSFEIWFGYTPDMDVMRSALE